MDIKTGTKFITASLLMHAAFLLALSQITAGSRVEMKEVVRVRLVEMPRPDRIERPESVDALSRYSSKAKEIKIPSDEPGGIQKKSAELPAGEIPEKHQPDVRAEAIEREKLKVGSAPQTIPPQQAEPKISPPEEGPKELSAAHIAPSEREAKLFAPPEVRKEKARPKPQAGAALKPRVEPKEKTPAARDKKGSFKAAEPKVPPAEGLPKEKAAPIVEVGPEEEAMEEVDNLALADVEGRRWDKSVAFLRNKGESKEGETLDLTGGGSGPGVLPGLSEDLLERYASVKGPGFGDPEETISLNTLDFKYFSYLTHVKESIKQLWRYPSEAIAQGLEGRLIMRFSILRDGSLEEVTLLSSSGYSILDDEAMRAVKDSSPFYPLPRSWSKDRLNINAVFIYRNLAGNIWVR